MKIFQVSSTTMKQFPMVLDSFQPQQSNIQGCPSIVDTG
jgi:hypothetical protein